MRGETGKDMEESWRRWEEDTEESGGRGEGERVGWRGEEGGEGKRVSGRKASLKGEER